MLIKQGHPWSRFLFAAPPALQGISPMTKHETGPKLSLVRGAKVLRAMEYHQNVSRAAAAPAPAPVGVKRNRDGEQACSNCSIAAGI